MEKSYVAGWTSDFPVWKTIKLGTGLKTADDFRRALKEGEFHVSEWANDILGRPTFTAATQETETDLVAVSAAELGFKNGAYCEDIYKRAQELGLELCPAELVLNCDCSTGTSPMANGFLLVWGQFLTRLALSSCSMLGAVTVVFDLAVAAVALTTSGMAAAGSFSAASSSVLGLCSFDLL